VADEPPEEVEHAHPEAALPRPIDEPDERPDGHPVEHAEQAQQDEIDRDDGAQLGRGLLGPAHRDVDERLDQRAAADVEVLHGAAVDEHEQRRGGGLDAGRDRGDDHGSPGDGEYHQQAEREHRRQRDDERVEDEALFEPREQDGGRAGGRHHRDHDPLAGQREQRRPIVGELAAEPTVDRRGEQAGDHGGDADEEHALPGVLQHVAGVERADARNRGDDEREADAGVPARRAEDVPRQARQIALRR